MSNDIQAVKIKLSGASSREEIIDVLRAVEAEKVLFYIDQRGGDMILEVMFLKKLSQVAAEREIGILFYTRRVMYRQILKQQGFAVYSEIPTPFDTLPMMGVGELLGRMEAQKNFVFGGSKKLKNVKMEVDKADFRNYKIENIENARSHRSWLFFLLLFLSFGLVVLYIWVQPRAVIDIKPRISSVPVLQNVIVALPEAEIPVNESNLPLISAIFVENTVSGTDTFSTLDKQYEVSNAYGEITLFNRTSEDKFLVPSRLSTEEGLIYRFRNNVTIPAGSPEAPGKLVVKIFADEVDANGRPIGSRGNVDAGTELFFPALREELQEQYYGKVNRGPLVGGSTLIRNFFGIEDVEKSKIFLADSLRFRALEQLKTELDARSEREGVTYALVEHPELLQSELTDFSAPGEELVGQEMDTFEMSGQMVVNGLVYSEGEVLKVLRSKLEKTQDHRKKILNIDPTSLQARILDRENFEADRWLKFSFQAQGVEVLDLGKDNQVTQRWIDEKKADIFDKTTEQARGLLANDVEIDQILAIKLSPFWRKSLPDDPDQIEFRVHLEE